MDPMDFIDGKMLIDWKGVSFLFKIFCKSEGNDALKVIRLERHQAESFREPELGFSLHKQSGF